MFNLTGKTALVTGATGGIGGAVARALHAQGATVVLSGTREAVLQDLAKELGERAFVAAANLSDAESVDGLVARAEEAARAAGHDNLALATHEALTENLAFYARLGWAETGRDGQKILMRKPLTRGAPT